MIRKEKHVCEEWIDGCEHVESRREKNSKCLIILLNMTGFQLNYMSVFLFFLFLFSPG